jgi:hypothetical protein
VDSTDRVLNLANELAKIQDLFRRRTTPILRDPDPLNVRWSKAADRRFSHPVLTIAVLEMDIVVKRAMRPVVRDKNHVRSLLSFM